MVGVVACHLISTCFCQEVLKSDRSWLTEEQLFIPSYLLPYLLLDLCFHVNPARPSLQVVPTKDFTDINSCITRCRSLISQVNNNLIYFVPARSVRACCALKHTHITWYYTTCERARRRLSPVGLSLLHHHRALLCPRCFQEGPDHPVTIQTFTDVSELLLGVRHIILIWLLSSFFLCTLIHLISQWAIFSGSSRFAIPSSVSLW